MTVLVYSRRSKRGTELSRILEVTSGDHVIDRVTGVQSLSERIQQLNVEVDAAVLLLFSRRELDKVLSLQETLFSIPVLLILPDRGEETVSKGHSLRPRYVTFLDSDFTETAAVLGRMLERAERLRSKWSAPVQRRKGAGQPSRSDEKGKEKNQSENELRPLSCGRSTG